jgi:hypothetical protein
VQGVHEVAEVVRVAEPGARCVIRRHLVPP